MSQPLPEEPGVAGAELEPGLAPAGAKGDGDAPEELIDSVARPKRRRRGSRGGRGRRSPGVLVTAPAVGAQEKTSVPAELVEAPLVLTGSAGASAGGAEQPAVGSPEEANSPEEAKEPAGAKLGATQPAPPRAPKPKIGDTRPGTPPVLRRAEGRARPAGEPAAAQPADEPPSQSAARQTARRRRRGAPPGAGQTVVRPGPAHGRDPALGGANVVVGDSQSAAVPVPVSGSGRSAVQLKPEANGRHVGREHRSRPLGRYLMAVHVGPTATQIAVLEGRALIEHYVSRPADDTTQIDGNIYLGRVQNVLPGMEAAFVDIGTPKNAVLYRGDLRFDEEDVEGPGDDQAKPTRGRLGGGARGARIEQLLRTGQSIVCQVTKNPIGTKGARLTQEVSLPGRFVVLIPNSETYGISKRLPDEERRRLRRLLDDIRPSGHGLIVRTAAEGVNADELRRDVERLLAQWEQVEKLARTSRAPKLLYREPDLAVRVIREEFNRDYRAVVIDDRGLYEQVREYVAGISPELVDRVELADQDTEALPLFERFRVHEQIHKALDRKVWLPSGGSLIIERTEALTVIDVNTGKNVGTTNLEETVFRNNLEAAEEIARQLRLRDIGGIIVIDFIDMEVAANRAEVIRTFREALARDKTRTQVFDISELGLVEMTRKRISEGLVESYSETCPTCGGRGIIFDESLL
ncbi:MAG: Rne/Rng family ribonuclease [Acidimicrobiales bacterium]